ncbi:winged helix-turn-helix transcriptional regulator [Candidatus Woesearchaeota archaeon]|nr:winged helix-turn-helix transcriptional regulator [Candidatus Woesearchaeota archaeon]
MGKKNFLLLSLEDTKIKKVSNVISNESCRKILDYLADREATETEIAEKLQIPISTVHYNLQQLMETGLISADEYHYSPKGKEVNHYRLANKYIIIAPKKTYGIKEKLRSILPVALIAAGAAGIIQLVQKFPQARTFAVQEAAMKSVAVDREVAAATAPAMTQSADAVQIVVSPLWKNIALWFFIGAVFALLVYFVISWYKREPN